MSFFEDLRDNASKIFGYWKDGCNIIGNNMSKSFEKVNETVYQAKTSLKNTFEDVADNIREYFNPDRQLADGVAHEYAAMGGKDKDIKDKIYDKDERKFNWSYFADTSDIIKPDNDGPEF